MIKPSYTVGIKNEDEMVAGRQFEVNTCKAITAAKERIMEL